MPSRHRFIRQFDWTLFSIVGALIAIGLLNIYSAGFSMNLPRQDIFLRQVQWIGVGTLLMILAFSIDYRWIVRHAYPLYGLSLILLVVVLFAGTASRGAQRWLSLGWISFQPSEFVKMTLILALTHYFNEHRSEQSFRLHEMVMPAAILLAPFVLIMKQPDLGTALVLLILFLAIALFVGVQWKSLLIGIGGGTLLVPLGWFVLRDYQRERILTFFDPARDPLGSGYHVIQSMIAVGSGGFFGKGYLKGSQTQLKFLPEQQTDFIFSAFAEEWGFAGSLLLLGLLCALILWGLGVARHARDLTGSLLAYGVTMLIFTEAFVNIGMVLGILPVVGIPLPFFSYGGSAMVTILAGIGLLLNVSMRRFTLQS